LKIWVSQNVCHPIDSGAKHISKNYAKRVFVASLAVPVVKFWKREISQVFQKVFLGIWAIFGQLNPLKKERIEYTSTDPPALHAMRRMMTRACKNQAIDGLSCVGLTLRCDPLDPTTVNGPAYT